MEKLQILVVDDKDYIRKLISRMISVISIDLNIDVEVLTAISSIEAVVLIHQSKKEFSFLLADLDCPNEDDGFEIIKYIKRKMPNCVCALMTARYKSDVIAQCREVGVSSSYFLEKPFNLENLASIVWNALASKK